MKRFIASLLHPQPAQRSEEIQTIDPKRILFTTPILSEDLPPLEPLSARPGSKDFALHEDEWSQIEFFPRGQLALIQQLLADYKRFEAAHRLHAGWSEVYLRRLPRLPVLSAAQPVARLEQLLEVKAGEAPILYTTGQISGRVKDGFSLALGGNVWLYGYVQNQGVPVLGAFVGKDPDDSRLTDAFLKLSAAQGLVLVDWRAQLLLIEAGTDSQLRVWSP